MSNENDDFSRCSVRAEASTSAAASRKNTPCNKFTDKNSLLYKQTKKHTNTQLILGHQQFCVLFFSLFLLLFFRSSSSSCISSLIVFNTHRARKYKHREFQRFIGTWCTITRSLISPKKKIKREKDKERK